MRLLHIRDDLSLQFEEFMGSDIPPYAILSHTWETEEVSYDDFINGRGPQMKGYEKIQGCAKLAKSRGLDYIWVDTCCIDKRSSAELTEAINSMFAWYEQSKECYAYLIDVPSKPWLESRWFTRGWTLQELIAPDVVLFYDVDWHFVEEKRRAAQLLHETTGIARGALVGELIIQNYSVAARMLWASKRVTTRIEDIAYCLMGIFDVNMPLLYGEGRKSFKRLQEEILRQTQDSSMLAWTSGSPGLFANSFAESPSCFQNTTALETHPLTTISSTAMTLVLRTALIPYGSKHPGVFQAIVGHGRDLAHYAIFVVEAKSSILASSSSSGLGHFMRIWPNSLARIERADVPSSLDLQGKAQANVVDLPILKEMPRGPLRKLPDHRGQLFVFTRFYRQHFGDIVQIQSVSGTSGSFSTKLQSGKLAGFQCDNGALFGVLVVGLTPSAMPWWKFLSLADHRNKPQHDRDLLSKQVYEQYQPQEELSERNEDVGHTVLFACGMSYLSNQPVIHLRLLGTE